MVQIMKENLTTPEEFEVVKDYFTRNGYDTSKLPWTKVLEDGTRYRVYKNTYRDKSGDFSGFIYERPVTDTFASIDDFLNLSFPKQKAPLVKIPNCS